MTPFPCPFPFFCQSAAAAGQKFRDWSMSLSVTQSVSPSVLNIASFLGPQTNQSKLEVETQNKCKKKKERRPKATDTEKEMELSAILFALIAHLITINETSTSIPVPVPVPVSVSVSVSCEGPWGHPVQPAHVLLPLSLSSSSTQLLTDFFCLRWSRALQEISY